jgi:pimeloyl-ACP methyl ester carboxylesterase
MELKMNKSQYFLLLSVVILITLISCSYAGSKPSPTFTSAPARFEKAECMVATALINYKIECGYLVVPEDRAQSDSRLIKLAVAIVRSSNAHPDPDPVVFLGGGPGGNTLDGLFSFSSGFSDILSNRDLIIFDQRGVGYSLPSLNCLEVENQHYQDLTQNLSQEELQQHNLQSTKACHDRLVEEGINLAAYTSVNNAADVNDLLIALGYTEWNLYGVSYGTRLALTVMRYFPKGVRSVVLDSVYPPQVDGYGEMAVNAERAFNLLFKRCAEDSKCNMAYPELKTIFYDTVAQLDTNPTTLNLVRSKTGQRYDVIITGDRLIDLTFHLLHQTDALPYLPKLIYDLHEGRSGNLDVSMIQSIEGIIFSIDYLSEGMDYSVQCGEEESFSSAKIMATVSATALPRLQTAINQYSIFPICALWGAKKAAAIENQPVVSDIPTLILEGDNDPITPPAWGQLAGKTLRNSHYFEFRWVGHMVFGAGIWGNCSKSMVNAFLTQPNTAPDAGCLDKLKVVFMT